MAETTVGRAVVRRAVAATAGVLFVGGGVQVLRAEHTRWGDACADDFDASACVFAQNHESDYVFPSEPWVPIGDSAQQAGVGYLLVGAGLALLFATIRTPVWSRVLQVAVVGAVLVLGLITLSSGLSGRLVQMEALTWWVMLSWVCPMPLIVVVVQWLADRRFDGPIPRPAWMACAVALVLATPLVEMYITAGLLPYLSHDTKPWSSVPGGVLFVLAGLVILGGLVGSLMQGRRPVQR